MGKEPRPNAGERKRSMKKKTAARRGKKSRLSAPLISAALSVLLWIFLFFLAAFLCSLSPDPLPLTAFAAPAAWLLAAFGAGLFFAGFCGENGVPAAAIFEGAATVLWLVLSFILKTDGAPFAPLHLLYPFAALSLAVFSAFLKSRRRKSRPHSKTVRKLQKH